MDAEEDEDTGPVTVELMESPDAGESARLAAVDEPPDTDGLGVTWAASPPDDVENDPKPRRLWLDSRPVMVVSEHSSSTASASDSSLDDGSSIVSFNYITT